MSGYAQILTFSLPAFALVRKRHTWIHDSGMNDPKYRDEFVFSVFSTAKEVAEALNDQRGEKPESVVGLWRMDDHNKCGVVCETTTHVMHMPNGEEKQWVEHDWKVKVELIYPNTIYQDDLTNHLSQVLTEKRRRRLAGDE